MTGLEVYLGSSAQDTLWAIIVASIVLTLIGGIMATIGTISRMSSYLLVRVAFGDLGAGVVNIAFALSLLGWFGVNIDLFADAVVTFMASEFAIELPGWPVEIFAGVCMVTTTLYGFRAINILATLMVPVLAFITLMLAVTALDDMSLVEYWTLEKAETLTVSDGVAAIVGAIIIGAIILPDITRFSRQRRGGAYTAIWAYLIIELIVLVVAAFAAAALVEDNILALLQSLGLGIAGLMIVVGGSWILNSLNLYSSVLCVKATFPSLNGRSVTLMLGAIGLVAAAFNLLDSFLDFLTFLAALFVPVAGVIIADFFMHRQRYQLSTLDDNQAYSWPALIAWACGVALSFLQGRSMATRSHANFSHRRHFISGTGFLCFTEGRRVTISTGGKTMRRIGIDVGGTHTDAVLLEGDTILSTTKAMTTADVTSGVMNALHNVLTDANASADSIHAVMIGTTQFTNAVVERRHLSEVAAIRIALPGGRGLPSMTDWPEDIAEKVGRHTYALHGGYLYDGWPMAKMIDAEIEQVIDDIAHKGLSNIAIASAFSPDEC